MEIKSEKGTFSPWSSFLNFMTQIWFPTARPQSRCEIDSLGRSVVALIRFDIHFRSYLSTWGSDFPPYHFLLPRKLVRCISTDNLDILV